MGEQRRAKCLACEKAFMMDDGGGFCFHLVRCVKCGKTKAIGFDELGELHVRYLKGLKGPYCVASAGRDADVQKNAPVKPISTRTYNKGVEAAAGECRCGGKYSLNAPPRCPKCHSKRIKKGATTVMYD